MINPEKYLMEYAEVMEKKKFEKILMNYKETEEDKKYIIDYFIKHYPDVNKKWNLCSIVFIKNPKLVKLICSNETCMNILKQNIKDLNDYYKELAYYDYNTGLIKIDIAIRDYNDKENNDINKKYITEFFKTYYLDKKTETCSHIFRNPEVIKLILNDKSCLEILQPNDCYDHVIKLSSYRNEEYTILNTIVDEVVKNRDLLSKCPNIVEPLINYYDILRKLLDNKIINFEYLFEHFTWYEFISSQCCSNLLKEQDFKDFIKQNKEINIKKIYDIYLKLFHLEKSTIFDEIIKNKEWISKRINNDIYRSNINAMINEIEFPKEVKPKYLSIIIGNRTSKISKLIMLHNIFTKSKIIFISKKDKKKFNRFVFLFDRMTNIIIDKYKDEYMNIITEISNDIIHILENFT